MQFWVHFDVDMDRVNKYVFVACWDINKFIY